MKYFLLGLPEMQSYKGSGQALSGGGEKNELFVVKNMEGFSNREKRKEGKPKKKGE